MWISRINGKINVGILNGGFSKIYGNLNGTILRIERAAFLIYRSGGTAVMTNTKLAMKAE